MTALMETAVKLEKRQHLLAHSCSSMLGVWNHERILRAANKQQSFRMELSIELNRIIHRQDNVFDGLCGKLTPDSVECISWQKLQPEKLRYRSFEPDMINLLNHYG
ncbi:hypothetical protein BIW11_04095 [Tropilaelaps mercedesae]|uniref:Uncharacterized protein n=1 Tax=Tropilaelaps mercedesae TaxID=418985 RepID=A0A1V9XBK4_9ACAR|nr:hypothetical protein BIW11_04095 [Tropilaelaps mercedesae]